MTAIQKILKTQLMTCLSLKISFEKKLKIFFCPSNNKKLKNKINENSHETPCKICRYVQFAIKFTIVSLKILEEITKKIKKVIFPRSAVLEKKTTL